MHFKTKTSRPVILNPGEVFFYHVHVLTPGIFVQSSPKPMRKEYNKMWLLFFFCKLMPFSHKVSSLLHVSGFIYAKFNIYSQFMKKKNSTDLFFRQLQSTLAVYSLIQITWKSIRNKKYTFLLTLRRMCL